MIMLQKFNKKTRKINSNINITKILHLPFDMLCFHLKNDITMLNALTIGKCHGKTPGLEQRK